MNFDPLLLVAAIVFTLMVTGLFYSMTEFVLVSDDPSMKKDSDEQG
jgi:hypothetical protein